MGASAISIVAIVPSSILAEVTEPDAILGSSALPVKSPANCIFPFREFVASGAPELTLEST